MAESPVWQARLESDDHEATETYCKRHGLSRSQAVRLGLQLLRQSKTPPAGGEVRMGPKAACGS